MQSGKYPGLTFSFLWTTLLIIGLSRSQSAYGQYRVRSVGDNSYGRLGNGSAMTSNAVLPVKHAANIRAIAAGPYHALALTAQGTVLAWGENQFGQLGNGTSDANAHPDPAPVNGLTHVIEISAGSRESLALKSDGTVWAWGYTPSQITALSDVRAISSGFGYNLALKNDGTVWAWGSNSVGQLGRGTIEDSAIPLPVSGLAHVVAVSAGIEHALALRDDGTVWSWGSNSDGKLGNGSTVNSSVPVPVTGLMNVTAISAGGQHSMALKNDGTVSAWGDDHHGQLGCDTGILTTPFSTSVPVPVLTLTRVTAISAGGTHSLAIETDGTAWSWGSNDYGKLGDALKAGEYTPLRPYAYYANRTGHVVAIQAGLNNSYFLSDDPDPDLNGDSFHDLVWQNNRTGDISAWYLNGAAWSEGYGILGTGVPTAWKTVASLDLNGDGKTDLVWQNTETGDVSFWLMDGAARKNADYIARNIPLEWKIVGAADFNGDGKPDLLWQNARTGDVTVWYMDGVTWTGSWDYVAHNVPTQWQIAGTANMSGQSGYFRQSDILWRNVQTGDVVVWYMIGATWTGSYDTIASGIPLQWRLAGISDVNDDLNPDLLWQNTQTGDVVVWYLQNAFWDGRYDTIARGIPLQWSLVRTH